MWWLRRLFRKKIWSYCYVKLTQKEHEIDIEEKIQEEWEWYVKEKEKETDRSEIEIYERERNEIEPEEELNKWIWKKWEKNEGVKQTKNIGERKIRKKNVRETDVKGEKWRRHEREIKRDGLEEKKKV